MKNSIEISDGIKKIAVIFAAGFFVAALSGCDGNQTSDNDEQNQQTEQMQNQEQTQKQVQIAGENSMFDNFKDAIGSGQKMKCTYAMTEDGQTIQSEAYVEGNKFKSISQINGQNYYAVNDGNTTYTWIDEQKNGTKLNNDCKIGTPETDQDQQGTDEESGDEEDAFQNAADVKCQSVDSIDFSIPSDIQFTDQCELLQNQAQQLQQMQQAVPQGVNIPGVQPE